MGQVWSSGSAEHGLPEFVGRESVPSGPYTGQRCFLQVAIVLDSWSVSFHWFKYAPGGPSTPQHNGRGVCR